MSKRFTNMWNGPNPIPNMVSDRINTSRQERTKHKTAAYMTPGTGRFCIRVYGLERQSLKILAIAYWTILALLDEISSHDSSHDDVARDDVSIHNRAHVIVTDISFPSHYETFGSVQ